MFLFTLPIIIVLGIYYAFRITKTLKHHMASSIATFIATLFFIGSLPFGVSIYSTLLYLVIMIAFDRLLIPFFNQIKGFSNLNRFLKKFIFKKDE